jgi:hypothetical protein
VDDVDGGGYIMMMLLWLMLDDVVEVVVDGVTDRQAGRRTATDRQTERGTNFKFLLLISIYRVSLANPDYNDDDDDDDDEAYRIRNRERRHCHSTKWMFR